MSIETLNATLRAVAACATAALTLTALYKVATR